MLYKARYYRYPENRHVKIKYQFITIKQVTAFYLFYTWKVITLETFNALGIQNTYNTSLLVIGVTLLDWL